MKKLSAAVAALICAAAFTVLAGCVKSDNRGQSGENNGIEQGYSISYAFTASAEVLEISDTSSMKDYMDALKEDGALAFEGSDDDYGYYITSVLGVSSKTVSSTANSYSGYDWAVYTTLTSLDGTIYSTDESTFNYNGVTLYKSSYGVSGLPCVEGHTYALVYEFTSMSW